MWKFLYFGKWYCSGLSLDEIIRKHDSKDELWAYEIGKGEKVSMTPTIISAESITNIQQMKQ